jgi:hypothetical protein
MLARSVMLALCTAAAKIVSTVLQTGDGRLAAAMPHLELPKFAPTYNLSKSTMTQLCFGPTPLGGAPLNNETGQFLRHWGVIEIDFESEESLWAHHAGGKNADVMMLEQASQMKEIAPESSVWIYRNLVQAYSNFKQLREKLEDPQYSGWWMKFDNATNDEKLTPRCAHNSRLNRTLCSDLFHSPLRWTTDGDDCGDIIPCGDYVFDHRNASLREWIVQEHMLGEEWGLGHPAVDGFGCASMTGMLASQLYLPGIGRAVVGRRSRSISSRGLGSRRIRPKCWR